MRRGRGPAAAGALACALAAAGCGLGAGGLAGDVELTVTRDYGARVMVRRELRDVSESETAMRALDRSAEVSTRYGGRFVESIDGVEGGRVAGRPRDWFFYVNGVEASVGAAEYRLEDGYRVWWDHRDWGAAMRVPAVVGSFPEPFRSGYEGRRRALRIRCSAPSAACREVRERLAPFAGNPASREPIRVLVGTWETLRSDPAAALIERGPQHSGVFADFVRARESWRLQPLDTAGGPAGAPADAGLVAATRDGDDPPTWLVTGGGAADTLAAARMLDPRRLRDRYAVAAEGRSAVPLPRP